MVLQSHQGSVPKAELPGVTGWQPLRAGALHNKTCHRRGEIQGQPPPSRATSLLQRNYPVWRDSQIPRAQGGNLSTVSPTFTGTATSEQPQMLSSTLTEMAQCERVNKISFPGVKNSNLFQGFGAILFLVSLLLLVRQGTPLSPGEQEDMNYLEAFQIIKKLLLFPLRHKATLANSDNLQMLSSHACKPVPGIYSTPHSSLQMTPPIS